jgi:hypothetical protein
VTHAWAVFCERHSDPRSLAGLFTSSGSRIVASSPVAGSCGHVLQRQTWTILRLLRAWHFSEGDPEASPRAYHAPRESIGAFTTSCTRSWRGMFSGGRPGRSSLAALFAARKTAVGCPQRHRGAGSSVGCSPEIDLEDPATLPCSLRARQLWVSAASLLGGKRTKPSA